MSHKPFKIFRNNLIVVARQCFGADNIWLFEPEIFVDRIVRDQYDELHVFAIDCENLILSGFLSVLNLAVRERKLLKDKVKIITYQDPKVTWATFVPWNSFPMNNWIKQHITAEDCVINNNHFSKRFLALFNRPTIYRHRLAKYMNENFYDTTILSCRVKPSLKNWKLLNEDEANWCHRLPIILDDYENFDYSNLVKGAQQFVQDYLIEIVAESEIYNSFVFTEKTMRSMYAGKPFILLAGPGSLKNLQRWGFKTFSPFIDESYDTIENTEDRFRAICNEINRLGNLPLEELKQFANDYRSIFEHNQDVFFSNSHPWQNWVPGNYELELFHDW